MGYIEELRAIIGHRQIILCGSVVLIQNKDTFLFQRRAYPQNTWSLPGGLMELGESAEDTAKREVLEETGLLIDKLKLVGVFSGQDHLCRAQNGDEWYVVTIAYTTNHYYGVPKVNDKESEELQWFPLDNLPLTLAYTHQLIVNQFLSSNRRLSGSQV